MSRFGCIQARTFLLQGGGGGGGNTPFVAVGGTNAVKTSALGVSWAQRSAPATFGRVGFNGTRFATLGYTSDDNGTSWTNRGAPSGSANRITGAGPLWVRAGANGSGVGALFSATDGFTWTQRQTGVSGVGFVPLYWDGSQYIALHASPSNGVQVGLYTSPDGQTWTSRSNNLPTQTASDNRYPLDIVKFGSFWYVLMQVSDSINTLYRSSDLASWTGVDAQLQSTGDGALAASSTAIVGTDGSTIIYSTTGAAASWNVASVATPGDGFAGSIPRIIFKDSIFCAPYTGTSGEMFTAGPGGASFAIASAIAGGGYSDVA